MDTIKLVKLAVAAREKSYSPYSKFKVGAALLAKSGVVYTGANIESAAYSPTNCAERTAFFTAVHAGERDFSAIAVAGWADDTHAGYCYPCGVCLQVMMEFCNPDDFVIIAVNSAGEYREYRLNELLPHGFGSANMQK